MLQQIPDKHVVLEVLVAGAIARIRFPHLEPGLVIESRATGDVLGIPLFLPRRHGNVAPIPEPFPHPEVRDFVSDDSAQTSFVRCRRASENQILRDIGLVDEDIVRWKRRVTLAEGIAADIEAQERIHIEPVGQEDPGFDVFVDRRRGQPGLDPVKNVVDALVERLPRIDDEIPVRELVSK